MSDILRIIARMFMVFFGFFLGCLGAALAYAFLAKLIIPEDFGRLDQLELTVTLAIGILGVSSLFARAVLLPALAFIALFEFLRRRDWLTYALSGGLIALAIAGLPLVPRGDANPALTMDPAGLIAIHVSCAIIGATVYWAIAGRNAGRWLPSERHRDDQA